MPELVLGFDKISEKLAGEKAMSLALMTLNKFPVPEGFVITADAFESFLEHNALESKIRDLVANADPDDEKSLRNTSTEIRNLILNGKLSEDFELKIRDAYEELSIGKEVKKAGGLALDLIKAGSGNRMCVAVRGSPLGASPFSGHANSYLNISSPKQVFDSVKKCWASFFNPNSIFYRKHRNIDRISLIVQKMIDSEKSGVIFTSDPSGDHEKVVVEASWGLGDSISSGIVTPDEYVLDKQTGSLLKKKISKKLWHRKKDESTGATITEGIPRDKMNSEVLNDSDLKRLFEIASSVESVFGKPQSIAWCEQREKFYLLTSAPIIFSDVGGGGEYNEGEVILSGFPASPGSAKGKSKVILSADISSVESGSILVMRNAGSAITSHLKKILGIVTDAGGRASHIVSLAREFRIPCVVGTESATSLLKDGQEIIIDGTKGKIMAAKERKTIETDLPSLTISEKLTGTEIKASLMFPETVADSKNLDGVGILKLETLFLSEKINPSRISKEEPENLVRLIQNSLHNMAKAFYPKPVHYSILDIRSDDFKDLDGEEEQESNPILGWRGVRRALDEPDVLKCELKAIRNLHEQGLDNISVILPFASNIDEYNKVKSLIDFPVKCGIMVDTPSVAIEIENFCKVVDFVVIGSDNLIQLVSGIDKDNPKVSRLYSELDSSFLKLVTYVIRTCKKRNIETCFSGEAANNPKLAEVLVSAGVTSISPAPENFEEIRNAVARAERKILLERK